MKVNDGLRERIQFIQENNIPGNTEDNIRACEKEIYLYMLLMVYEIDMEWDEFLNIVAYLAESQLGMF